jgi:hypothetical protein
MFLLPAQARDISFVQTIQTGSLAHPASDFVGADVAFPQGEAVGAKWWGAQILHSSSVVYNIP